MQQSTSIMTFCYARLKACIEYRFRLWMLIMICVSAIFIFPAYSKAQGSLTGSRIKSADANKMLGHHNKIRRDVGVAALTWDKSIAAYAQEWADYLANSNNCNLMHRSEENREEKVFGENIYWCSADNGSSPFAASQSWYEEIKHYTYGRLNENNWRGVGHYTQMVWKTTTSMGAGMATCPSGGVVVVANYNPPGNYMGDYPY